MKKKQSKANSSRRDFLKNGGLSLAGFYIVPRHVLGGVGYQSPSDTLNIAVIGAGGRGSSHVTAAAAERIIALVDVDDRQSSKSYEMHPKVKKFKDFRKMYDQVGEDLDAVMVATPDHTHAVIALPAIEMGKHVYVEKPLTHNVYEARRLTEAARKHGVVTQMGNQGASGEGVRQTMEWIQSGIIGEVFRVDAWTNRPVWPQGVKLPQEKQEVPKELDWDLWLGPAKHRAYHPTYLPFNWRGWWEFGTGAMGDMGCHILDPVFKSLNLTYPTRIEGSMSTVYEGFFQSVELTESCPPSSTIYMDFPKTLNSPAIELVWYDGGIMPRRPQELKDGEPFGNWDGGVLFEGTNGKLLVDCYGSNPRLLPTSIMEHVKVEPSLDRVPNDMGGHMQDFFKACKENNPKHPSSNFDYAGPFTEAILLGNLALRGFYAKTLIPGKNPDDRNAYEYPGRTSLQWDAEQMKITNVEIVNQFVKRDYRSGWEI